MSSLQPAIATAITPFIPKPIRPRPVFVSADVLTVMRFFAVKPASHDDLIEVIAGMDALIARPSALSEKCTTVIRDLFAEVIGQVEQDQVNQLVEVTA